MEEEEAKKKRELKKAEKERKKREAQERKAQQKKEDLQTENEVVEGMIKSITWEQVKRPPATLCLKLFYMDDLVYAVMHVICMPVV